MPDLVTAVKTVLDLYFGAVKDLGPDLGGGSITDLVLDNTNWTMDFARQAIECAGYVVVHTKV